MAPSQERLLSCSGQSMDSASDDDYEEEYDDDDDPTYNAFRLGLQFYELTEYINMYTACQVMFFLCTAV